jgi:hypothetical protein
MIKIYTTAILNAVSYECERWSVVLREKDKFRAPENRVLEI